MHRGGLRPPCSGPSMRTPEDASMHTTCGIVMDFTQKYQEPPDSFRSVRSARNHATPGHPSELSHMEGFFRGDPYLDAHLTS